MPRAAAGSPAGPYSSPGTRTMKTCSIPEILPHATIGLINDEINTYVNLVVLVQKNPFWILGWNKSEREIDTIFSS